ncbi:MAG TPA: ribbon-helix-helix protein, CopG family [Thermoanaerobaculia bacterium]|nr:ribbon-helix-helix protein, CopG family [Thermoanaerobaculia bacterium]
MTPISLQVDDHEYQRLRLIAEREGKPVTEVAREALVEYLERHPSRRTSIFEVAPHESGALLRPWSRSELQDEMRER